MLESGFMQEPSPQSLRRWSRYSLRSLLVAITAAAIWLGVTTDRAIEQRRAVEFARAAGADG